MAVVLDMDQPLVDQQVQAEAGILNRMIPHYWGYDRGLCSGEVEDLRPVQKRLLASQIADLEK